MRVNVYGEEIPCEPEIELVYKANGASPVRPFLGVRVYLHSSPMLQNTDLDDDRSAVTFWGREKVRDLAEAMLKALNEENVSFKTV